MATQKNNTRRAAAPQLSHCERLLSDDPVDRRAEVIQRMTAVSELLSMNNSDNTGVRKLTFNTVGDILLGYLDELRDCDAAERAGVRA